MQNRFIPLLLLTVSFVLYIACSNQPGTTPADTSNAASGAASPAASSPATDLEPVMPEKVQVAFEHNCKDCHGSDAHGIPTIAPDLRKAARRSLTEWVAYMKDQKGAHSSTKIPKIASLTDEDFEAIGGYLADLTQNNPPAAKK